MPMESNASADAELPAIIAGLRFELQRFYYYLASDMEAQNMEVASLVQKITGLHSAISKLPSLSPSPEVDRLFTDLVMACVPTSPVDVTKLDPETQKMREELIRLNYINLSKLEYELLVRYIPGLAPSRVAFVGSGPLPFSSLVLAAHHLPNTHFDNYDMCGPANERAQKLFRADEDLRTRIARGNGGGEEKASVVAHLGRHMADGAALVVRSAHGARGFLYPIVDPEDIRRGGFDVLAVYHPEGEVINSVIIARKVDALANGLQNGRAHAKGAMPIANKTDESCKREANALQKREEMVAAEEQLAF
ncbi:hypothetical protein PR202_ga25969 [Eleusine coracana subsp. coracana]|uniref:Nicotianamine synthase n=1 Tax=Eleusine coracana subsp. coracana TaxID=191504 RepID=A0AAV5DCR1_ELECO|nr:hypothetical protein PR202_ga25969 [Eleusine coracana subsp. coracana]